ncbi:MAG: hypothetical protein JXR30_00475 [Alphaproteobacteria bacterium]|nr:hypothetical protein [Alphaproteobacteria bacterium]
MQIVLTFLAYFLLGLMTGTLFSNEVKVVMDQAVVPTVKDVYSFAKDEIVKSKQKSKESQTISSTVEVQVSPKSNTPEPVGIDRLGYEVYQDDKGYYVIDEAGTEVPVLESEIVEFYSE